MATLAFFSRCLMCSSLLVVVLLCLTTTGADAFRFNFMLDLGLAYKRGDTIPILASSVTSKSKIVSLRYQDVFPCYNVITSETVAPAHRNIGQTLMGDTRVASGMKVTIGEDVECMTICSLKMESVDVMKLQKQILGRYRAHMFLDGLPVMDKLRTNKTRLRSSTGVQLGNVVQSGDQTLVLVHNHYNFEVLYYESEQAPDEIRIVQFNVAPQSIGTAELLPAGVCELPREAGLQTAEAASRGITFSYSVKWSKTTVPFITRWDAYIGTTAGESKVHWYSILNVFSLVLVQSVLLWYLFVRAVRRDIFSYNEEDLLGDREDSGWKLVSGDVFRPPRGAVVLSMLVGNGLQLFCMALASLLLSVVGMVSSGSRGMLVTLLIGLFVFFASVNGLMTATLTKLFHRRSWQTILLTSVVLPGFIFAVYLTLNFIHLGSHAATTLPFTSLLYLLSLWLLISVPLCYAGAVMGFNTNINIPVKVNSIPRTIPPQPWYMRGLTSYAALGVVPFAASYVELQSIFSSVWLGAGYHMFGFLTAAFGLVLVIVAQISIFSTYYQLNLLNYHWWWRSFAVSASYGLWLIAYCVFYYLFLSVVKGFWGMVLYFGYMALVSVMVSLIFGSIGFMASLTFVRIIYSSVKAD